MNQQLSLTVPDQQGTLSVNSNNSMLCYAQALTLVWLVSEANVVGHFVSGGGGGETSEKLGGEGYFQIIEKHPEVSTG